MVSTTARRNGRPRRSPASPATTETALRTELRQATDTIGLLQERLDTATAGIRTDEAGVADLERQLTGDAGWRLFSVLADREFSADGMAHLRKVCRLMNLANPLIKRGLNLRSFYVWGQGCQIAARANGRARDEGAEAEQDVQAAVAAFMQDPANQRAVFGAQARDELEHALGTDGEVFIALFTRPASGWVQARTITADEIVDVITDPDDVATPWFYRRQWSRNGVDRQGRPTYSTEELLYPDVDFKPRRRPSSYAGVPIAWDVPVVHVAVNRPLGWLRGIPDCYAAINWSRAYKEFLEQWSSLMRSLARFAWRLTTEGKNKTQAKAAIAAAGTTTAANGERNDVGGVAITPLNGQFEAIPKSGATIDAESGRPLAMMVAAGLDVPVTMLLADPGQTGARATAETLDWPTELAMLARRELWTAAQLRIVRHVITEAVRAPKGALKGTVKRDPVTEREVVELAGDTDDTIDIVWPPLDEVEPKDVIDAVVAAAATQVLPPELVLRKLLEALGVRDIESIMDEMVDQDGNFQWPQPPPMGGPGQQAADLARAGLDPAAAGPGRMGPDGQPLEQPEPEVEGVSAEAAARQADADFGLFGGRGADQSADEPADQAEPEQTPPAGETPAGLFDPEFFRL